MADHTAENGFEAFLKWAQQTRFALIATEVALVDDERRYGGTLDAVGEVDGEAVIFDWKTSKRLYANYVSQVAAYQNLWHNGRLIEHEDGKRPDYRLVDADTGKRKEKVPSVTTVLDGFQSCGGLIHWANELGLQGINHRDASSEAATIGTKAHKMIGDWIADQPKQWRPGKPRPQLSGGAHIVVLNKETAGFRHQYFQPATVEMAWRRFMMLRAAFDMTKALDAEVGQ